MSSEKREARLVLEIEIPDVPIDEEVEVFESGEYEGMSFFDLFMSSDYLEAGCAVVLVGQTEDGRFTHAKDCFIVGARYVKSEARS